MKDLCVELKVCEGCGALYLRDTESCAGVVEQGRGVYCQGCERWYAQFPAAGKRLRTKGKRRTVRTAVCAGGAR
jgi:hypothetical protein